MALQSKARLKHYLAVIHVRFPTPVELVDRATRSKHAATGYFVKMGLSLTPGQRPEKVIASMVDGIVVWKESTIEDITWEEMDDRLRADSKDFGRKRVWFYGSEFYYPVDA